MSEIPKIEDWLVAAQPDAEERSPIYFAVSGRVDSCYRGSELLLNSVRLELYPATAELIALWEKWVDRTPWVLRDGVAIVDPAVDYDRWMRGPAEND